MPVASSSCPTRACSARCSRTTAAIPSVDRHRRAHYAAMAVKSAQGAEERDWIEYDRAYVRSIGVADGRRRGGGAGARPHPQRRPVAVGDPRAPRRAAGPRRAGVPLGVVSNASGQIEAVLRRSGVCQVGPGAGVEVRCVVDSHVVGVAKPDPAIFEHADVHFPGIDRSRIAYVGDSVTMDVVGRQRGRTPPDPRRPVRRPPRRRLRPHQVARRPRALTIRVFDAIRVSAPGSSAPSTRTALETLGRQAA